MYGTDLPRTIELLKAEARVCKIGSDVSTTWTKELPVASKWLEENWLHQHNSSSK
jgi:hypothetical protein